MCILIHSIKFYITINNNNNDDDNINNHYYYPSIKLYISIALLIFLSFKHHLHNHSHNSIFLAANGWVSVPLYVLFVCICISDFNQKESVYITNLVTLSG